VDQANRKSSDRIPQRSYHKERDAAVEAARAAARLIRARAGRLGHGAVRDKGVHDLVTEVDEEAQRLIIEILKDAFPDYGVLAEEGADDGVPATAGDGHRWIIDPIDGTTNFTHGVPPYAVSIALQHGEEMVVGVVLNAAHEELFTAIRGRGAYANGARIRVSETEKLDRSLLTTGFPYRAFGHVDAYLELLRYLFQAARGIRRPGVASIDLAYVACGRFDGFFETGLNPWDIAAGLLLVEEAGGRVTDYKGAGNPSFTHQVLATNGHIHGAMLEAVAGMRDIYG
jgi:myo-inositol-1(or 4)-monophosphatase